MLVVASLLGICLARRRALRQHDVGEAHHLLAAAAVARITRRLVLAVRPPFGRYRANSPASAFLACENQRPALARGPGHAPLRRPSGAGVLAFIGAQPPRSPGRPF